MHDQRIGLWIDFHRPNADFFYLLQSGNCEQIHELETRIISLFLYYPIMSSLCPLYYTLFNNKATLPPLNPPFFSFNGKKIGFLFSQLRRKSTFCRTNWGFFSPSFSMVVPPERADTWLPCVASVSQNKLSSPVIAGQILQALLGFRGSKSRRLRLKWLLSNGATAVRSRVTMRAPHFPDMSITKPHADLYYTAHLRPYNVSVPNKLY